MLEFKIDIMKELKKKGWNSPKIRESKLIGQKTLSDIKKGIVPGIKTIENLCYMLNVQPGSIIRYVPDPTGSEPVTSAALEAEPEPDTPNQPHQDATGTLSQ